jgi:hypothetical protein
LQTSQINSNPLLDNIDTCVRLAGLAHVGTPLFDDHVLQELLLLQLLAAKATADVVRRSKWPWLDPIGNRIKATLHLAKIRHEGGRAKDVSLAN